MQRNLALALLLAVMVPAGAQTRTFEIGAMYQCPNGRALQVISCVGPANTDLCDVVAYAGGEPKVRGKNTRAQILAALPVCTGPSQPAAKPAAAGAGPHCAASLPPGRHRNEYEQGDLVQVNVRGAGWLDGTIVYIALGIDNEYRIKVAGDRTVAATAADMCFVTTAEADRAARTLGKPPKPGLASCAGKFEGRYSSTAGPAGLVSITFRSGRASVRTPDVVSKNGKVTSLESEQEAECWTGGGKIYLVWVDGSDFDFPIDINDDGTLDTQYGELRKKGN